MIIKKLDYWHSKTIYFNDLLKLFFIDKLVRKFILLFSNIVIPAYYMISPQKVKKLNNSGNVIVSITSFPSRIHKLWIIIESILRQTTTPDNLIIWLSKEQFSSISTLPSKLIYLQKFGIQIILVDDDFKSHKKFYYTLLNYPFSTFITIDDDILYPEDFIENLLNTHKKYPKNIICNRAIIPNSAQLFNHDMKKWKAIDNNNETLVGNYFFTTGGGVLFPPNTLDPEVLDYNIFLKYTPFSDDIWLNSMARLRKTPIVKSNYNSILLSLIFFNNIKLSHKNNALNFNNKQLNSINSYYKSSRNIYLY